MNETLLSWGIGTAITVGILAFTRYFPKSKAIDLANKLGDIVGIAITTFGNSRFGKKVWNKVEEGPITTVLAFGMALFVRIGSKMVADNYTVDNTKDSSNNDKQNKE